ncbi:MAG: choice-of-anchor J domain-containing protein, partial [Acutalibacteraceae bacterium]
MFAVSFTVSAESDSGNCSFTDYPVSTLHESAESAHTMTGYKLEWSESFENGAPDGWRTIDRDGDGNSWFLQDQSESGGYKIHHGNTAIVSESYINGTGSLNPENWLILPEQTLVVCMKYKLTFVAVEQDSSSYYKETLGVYISTDSGANYSQIGTDYTITQAYQHIEVDLSAYAGKKVKIAIIHYKSEDNFRLNLDCFYLWSKTSHSLVTEKAVAATCTTDGHTAYRKCQKCGKLFAETSSNTVTKQDILIPATGHKTKTTVTAATTSKNGSIVKTCTVCKKKISSQSIAYAKTFTLSKTVYSCTGKTVTPSVTVKDSKGKTLKKGTDYTVTYPKSRKNPGTYSVKVTLKGNYKGSKTLKFKIKPGTVTGLKKITYKGYQLSLQWNSVAKATGYQVQKYDTKSKKWVVLGVAKGTKIGFKKISGTNKWRVRAVITVGSKNYYGNFSKTLTTKS